MNAADLISGLVKVGVSIKDAVSKSVTGGSIDWTKALEAVAADPSVSATVKDFMKTVTPSDVSNAIAEIDAKQTKLLNGRQISQLTGMDLLNYSDLADARLVLATSQLKSALTPAFLQWIVTDALPTLSDVITTVLPLLL
jgi:hypothetical protein